MKSVIIIGVLALVALSSAETVLYPRGCIWVNGRCFKECPEGTHGYSTGCGYKTPEASCAQPKPVTETATICDYTACYCDAPTIRDENTDRCVMPEDCSPLIPKPGVLIPPPQATIEPPVDPKSQHN